MQGNVLIVDDDASMCELLADTLDVNGHQTRWVTNAAAAVAKLEESEPDVVIADLQLGDESGLELCRRINERWPDLPVVVITAFGSMDAAIGAIRAGAYDFINKPVDAGPLSVVVERAIDHHRLRREVKRLQQAADTTRSFDSMIGESKPMKKVYDLLSRLSESDAATLISGESGTGKELVAKALHRQSSYREGPFIAINCAAVPATLLESTLFGHMKGAFTDAKADRKGLFVEADGGTLFLDEIGEMPLEMQSKLLRVLQERKVRPVGGSDLVPFDTRIIAATNRDLEEDVEHGRFRDDLFYRIAVVIIDVPPLRARGNDILLLAQHFLEEAARRSGKDVTGIDSEAARKLLDYEWPGNVRQLQNVMERAVALTQFERITVDDLPEKVTKYQATQLVVEDNDPQHMLTLEQLERRYIARVLKATGGNKTQAAGVLGIDRRTLYRKLDRTDA
jgi:two-component system response regulator HydG